MYIYAIMKTVRKKINIHNRTRKHKSTKTLVLYVFHIVNDRVRNFIKNAIFYDKHVDFIVISNNLHAKITVPSYVKTIYRKNVGFDFGAWSEALLKNNLYKHYDNFVFVNSSVDGPYLPSNFKGKWTDLYIHGLKKNVKLFGSMINTNTLHFDKNGNRIEGTLDPTRYAHVQSYVFAMNKSTLEYLIQCEIFSVTNYAKTFTDAILNKEVLMSRKIIEHGWNIGALMKYYKGVDFTFSKKSPESYNIKWLGNVFHPKFRGIYWNNSEVVFIKGNR